MVPPFSSATAQFTGFVADTNYRCYKGLHFSRKQGRLRRGYRYCYLLLSISEAFDSIYSVLWEAPVAGLKLIESAGTSGIPAARLRPIYEEAATRFPEIYEGCGFVPWLQFLEETQLISWHGCNVVLTPDGHAFLKFRFVTDAMVEA